MGTRRASSRRQEEDGHATPELDNTQTKRARIAASQREEVRVALTADARQAPGGSSARAANTYAADDEDFDDQEINSPRAGTVYGRHRYIDETNNAQQEVGDDNGGGPVQPAARGAEGSSEDDGSDSSDGSGSGSSDSDDSSDEDDEHAGRAATGTASALFPGTLAARAAASTDQEILNELREISSGLKSIVKELRKAAKALQKVSKGGSGGSGKGKNKELTNDDKKRMLAAAQRLMATNAYPDTPDIRSAVVVELEFANTDAARQDLGYTKFMAMCTEANSKLTSTVRANFSHAIKKEFPVAYQFVCSDEGKVDKKKAKKLLDGDKYRAKSPTSPYGSKEFLSLLKNALQPLLKPPSTAGPINWLGKGHVAYADTLVWWMLKGNTQVPKPNDAGHDKFFSRWTKTLSETNARDNSPELKFKAF